MRFSILFASGALASSMVSECIDKHSSGLAALSECANRSNLRDCLSVLAEFETSDIESCLLDAGCSADDARLETESVFSRCTQWAQADLLRRRAAAPYPEPTFAPVFRRQDDDSTTLQCLTSSVVTREVCETTTIDGDASETCSSAPVTETECVDGLTCSMDSQGATNCMEIQDALDTAGIIIAIVFGVAIALGVGTLTYLCCQDRREQKRLTAKAEATALARAATKKQRSAEARAPLMQRQPSPGPAPGAGDPFGDRQHS